MHIIRGISASIASKIESAANLGGTYITDASIFKLEAASVTVLKTGKSKCFVPVSYTHLTLPTN